jgi:diguanylate cyclase (GGDEF)-like protein
MKNLFYFLLTTIFFLFISIRYTQYLIMSPIWIINVFISYYLIKFRKIIKSTFFGICMSFVVIFVSAYFFDQGKDLKTKFLLSTISTVNILIFVYSFYYIRLFFLKSKRFYKTILISLPNIIGAFVGGILFMLSFKIGERYYEFLDYFLEQFATGISIFCILYGIKEWYKIDYKDYILVAIFLFVQYVISTDSIFYACFIFPFLMCYISVKYKFKEICFLFGLLAFICSVYITIPLSGEYWNQQEIYMLSKISSYRLALGCYLIVFLFISEIYSRNRQLNYEYKRMMFCDELTGLKNRRYVREKVLEKYIFQDGYILLLDIDDFKKVNDKYGHHIGDLVIKHISNLLIHFNLENKVISRWGGEEFLIISSNKTKQECIATCNQILELCNKIPFGKENIKIHATVSIGAVSFNSFDSNSYEKLIQEVDRCLYDAKGLGKRQYKYGGTF